MVLPLIAAGVGTAGSVGFNMLGARERQRALEDVANQEAGLAQWYAAQNDRLMNQNITKYGELSRQRRAGIGQLLAGYTATPQVATQATPIEGDPRFSLSGDFGGQPGAGRDWANTSRTRIGRGLALKSAVQSAEDMDAAERLQRAEAIGGYQQQEGRLGRSAADYGDLADIRMQDIQNQYGIRQADLARAGMKAGQAGSEKMLYGGLFGLAGQAGASFLPMGGAAAAAAPATRPVPAVAPQAPWWVQAMNQR